MIANTTIPLIIVGLLPVKLLHKWHYHYHCHYYYCYYYHYYHYYEDGS